MFCVERPLEDVALGGRADLVGAEVVRATAPRVVLGPVLDHVVGDGAGGRPVVAVDRGLRVRVDVVQQRKARGERVQVRGDFLAEQGQRRVAVAARVVAQHLVVGAVLLDDEEDVLDRPVGSDRRACRRSLAVDRDDLAVGLRRQLADPLVGWGSAGSPTADDRRQVLEAVMKSSESFGSSWPAVRVRPDAEPFEGSKRACAVGRGRCRHVG